MSFETSKATMKAPTHRQEREIESIFIYFPASLWWVFDVDIAIFIFFITSLPMEILWVHFTEPLWWFSAFEKTMLASLDLFLSTFKIQIWYSISQHRHHHHNHDFMHASHTRIELKLFFWETTAAAEMGQVATKRKWNRNFFSPLAVSVSTNSLFCWFRLCDSWNWDVKVRSLALGLLGKAPKKKPDPHEIALHFSGRVKREEMLIGMSLKCDFDRSENHLTNMTGCVGSREYEISIFIRIMPNLFAACQFRRQFSRLCHKCWL